MMLRKIYFPSQEKLCLNLPQLLQSLTGQALLVADEARQNVTATQASFRNCVIALSCRRR